MSVCSDPDPFSDPHGGANYREAEYARNLKKAASEMYSPLHSTISASAAAISHECLAHCPLPSLEEEIEESQSTAAIRPVNAATVLCPFSEILRSADLTL